MPDANSRKSAAVQVWGKGFRATADSEEFQRYVPQRLSTTSDLEQQVEHVPWGRLLPQLYSLSERDLTGQRSVLLNASELMAFAFAHTEDRHRRPSIVMTTATVEIDWNDIELGETASRTVSLCSRLAKAYAETLRGNPENIGRQLRTDAFLPSRFFELSDEGRDDAFEWGPIVAAVKKWRGVVGIGTPKLLLLGVNVVLGTKFEAERSQQQFQIDGYYDLREKEIKPLTERLVPWSPPEVQPLSTTSAGVVSAPPLAEGTAIAAPLHRIADALHRIADLGERVFEYIMLARIS
jgi:hypothetical protein